MQGWPALESTGIRYRAALWIQPYGEGWHGGRCWSGFVDWL